MTFHESFGTPAAVRRRSEWTAASATARGRANGRIADLPVWLTVAGVIVERFVEITAATLVVAEVVILFFGIAYRILPPAGLVG